MTTINRKSDSLQYVSGFSPETVEKMKEVRAAFVRLARLVEDLGSSRELSEAFTHIETAQMYAIKHVCLAAPEGVLSEPV
jgi:hypothetical protein